MAFRVDCVCWAHSLEWLHWMTIGWLAKQYCNKSIDSSWCLWLDEEGGRIKENAVTVYVLYNWTALWRCHSNKWICHDDFQRNATRTAAKGTKSSEILWQWDESANTRDGDFSTLFTAQSTSTLPVIVQLSQLGMLWHDFWPQTHWIIYRMASWTDVFEHAKRINFDIHHGWTKRDLEYHDFR